MTPEPSDPAVSPRVCLDFLRELKGQTPSCWRRWLLSIAIGVVNCAVGASSEGLLQKILRRGILAMSVVYALGLCLIFGSLQWVGEANITTAFLLYLPPLGWFLPVIPLLGVSLLLYQRVFLALCGWVLFVSFYVLDYRLGHSGVPDDGDHEPREISVMTYNRGQHMNQSLQPFKQATRPDLLVFQDSPNRAEIFLRTPDYAEFSHGGSVGEFTLLSRYPILEKTLLPLEAVPKQTRFARFVVDWQGHLISVYAVHLKSPREVLNSYSRGAFLWGLLGLPGTVGETKRKQYQVFWDEQIKDAERVLSAARHDPHPCILAGDFNAPSLGRIHRLITHEMTDTHQAAGDGFGFSFPGVTRNPLSFGGPWLRIDYIFHDPRWQTLQCITEPDRPSQHRAVVARLRLSGDGRDGHGGE